MAIMGVNEMVLAAIQKARVEALNKHGLLTRDPVRACAILGREWGEAMNEALLATVKRNRMAQPVRSDGQTWTEFDEGVRLLTISELYKELAQVAATAIFIMEYIQLGQLEGQ